jgi:hypothetical protein
VDLKHSFFAENFCYNNLKVMLEIILNINTFIIIKLKFYVSQGHHRLNCAKASSTTINIMSGNFIAIVAFPFIYLFSYENGKKKKSKILFFLQHVYQFFFAQN